MTEPKWWPKGTIPSESGNYFSFLDGGAAYWQLPMKNLSHCPQREFYGPIPEPPREPPKIRRFTAKYQGRLLSGIMLEGDNMVRTFEFTPKGEPTTAHCFIQLHLLSDIQWLDKEQP